MRHFWTAILLLGLSIGSAFACAQPQHSAAAQSEIPENQLNAALFANVLTAEVNFARCKAGRAALSEDQALNAAAQMHSQNMAKMQKMAHKLNIRGQRSLSDRFKVARVNMQGYGAENIAREPALDITPGKPFQVIDRAKCAFRDPATGAPITRHSYASLAASVMTAWMASSGHKKNILSRKAKRFGAGIALHPTGGTCGDFYLTQTFAG